MPLFRTSLLLLLVLGTGGLFADANTTISAAEYFVDTDPGEGNGTALAAQDGAFDSEVEAIAPVDFNVTGLSVGPHLIGIRYKDNNNTWGEVLYQTIHVYDANPHIGGSGGGDTERVWPPADGTVQTGTLGQTSTWTVSGASYGSGTYVADSSVTLNGGHSYSSFDGEHNLYSWHSTQNTTAGILSLQVPEAFILSKYEIYRRNSEQPDIRHDDGFCPKNWTIEASNDGTNWIVLDTQTNQTFASGVEGEASKKSYPISNHSTAYNHYRINVTANSGGSYLVIGELKLYGTSPINASVGFATISGAEYFLDTDPGEGNGTAFQAKDGAFDSEVESILPKDLNVTGLSVGPHLVGVRYKDNNNTWGEVLYQTIHVYDANPSGSGSGGSGGGGSGGASGGFASISAAEYFVDTDPGAGSGIAFQAKDGAFDSEVESILPKDLNVTGLSVGPHLVGVRYKDSNNTWGEVLYQTIHVYDANPEINNGGSGGSGGTGGFTVIAGAEYFIGNDPGEGNATALQPKDGAFDSEVESTLTASLSLNGYALGTYLVGVRYKDNNGTWGDVLFKTIEVDVDTDGDGLADKAETFYETNATIQDTDGDGYLDGEEVAFGSDPNDAESIVNYSPTDLNSTTLLTIAENQPIGTMIGQFTAMDQDALKTPAKSFELITVDANWTLAKQLTDIRNANDPFYHIYMATTESEEEHNESLRLVVDSSLYGAWLGANDVEEEGVWRWTEGLEGNFSNGQGTVFWQNGTVEGQFNRWEAPNPNNGSDSQNEHFLILKSNGLWNDRWNGWSMPAYLVEKDRIRSVVFSFVPGAGDTHNHLFTLESNGTLRSTKTFDFESDPSSYSVRIQARDEHNATIEGNFTIALTDIFEDNDGDGFSNQMEAIAGTNPNHGKDRPTIDFGLVGHYPFDGDASDHSGFNNHGTIIGGVAPTSDRNLMPGQALSFNGTDGMITIPHSESLEFAETQGMSLHLWAYLEQETEWIPLIRKGYSWEFRLFGGANGPINFVLHPNGTGISSANGLPSLNQWHSFAITLNRFSKEVLIYLDGETVKEETFADFSRISSGLNLVVGQHNQEDFFKGKMDELKIYNRVLSSSEIGKLYFIEKPNTAPTNLGFGSTGIESFIIKSNQAGSTSFIDNLHISDLDTNDTVYSNDFSDNNLSGLILKHNADDGNGEISSSPLIQTVNGELKLGSVTGSSPGTQGYNSYSHATNNFELPENFEVSFNARKTRSGGHQRLIFRTTKGIVFETAISGQTLWAFYDYVPHIRNVLINSITPTSYHYRFTKRGTGWQFRLNGTLLAQSNSLSKESQPLKMDENVHPGHLLGRLSATDIDYNSSLTYHLVDGNETNDNQSFTLSVDGLLRSNQSFDHEIQSTYKITVKAADEYNASTTGELEISILNVIEDNDEDGIEDYYDPDDDNDGFSDAVEITYGSNPFDSNSIANTPPHALALSDSNFSENLPIGTIIGTFSAIDPDANTTLAYSFHDLNSSGDMNLFELETNGTLRTKSEFDYETNASTYYLVVRATDEYGAFAEGNFTLTLLDVNETIDSGPDDNQTAPPTDHNNTDPDIIDHNKTNPYPLPVPEYFRPLVRTGQANGITPNTAILMGKIIDDGNATISERGFLLSTLPLPHPNRAGTQKLIADGFSSEFEVTANDLQSKKKYFYRAYAINAEGLSLGSVESFTTYSYQNGPRWIDAQSVTDTENWWSSPWFGNFYAPDNKGWIMHEHLGWLFVFAQPDRSIWLWKEELGWLWTNRDLHPFLYANKSGSWLFHHGGNESKILFYEYGLNRWLKVEK